MADKLLTQAEVEVDDIDKWLAENLMGWTNVVLKTRRNSKSLIGTPPDARFISMGVTHFSSSWATVWPVVKAMEKRGCRLHLWQNRDLSWSTMFIPSSIPTRSQGYARNANPAMAICLAAKAALEVKEERDD